MNKAKEILYKMFNPKGHIVFINFLIVIALCIYIFIFSKHQGILAYISYLVSAYSLIVTCIWIGKKTKEKINKIIDNNKYINKYFKDVYLKTKVVLLKSSIINLAYVIFKFTLGVYYKSVWFITFSLYYLLLLVMRYNLLISQKKRTDNNLKNEYFMYRKCGVILLLMNVILTVIILLIINQNMAIRYNGMIACIVMAIYTFYILITGIVDLVRYKKYKRPIISASKVVDLVAGLISMLSLEVAMLYEFGTPEATEFNKIMIGLTGGGISIVIIFISLYMIIKSTEWINRSGNNEYS